MSSVKRLLNAERDQYKFLPLSSSNSINLLQRENHSEFN